MVNAINKNSQILLIEKFLISDEKTLLINQVSEELGIFYLGIIKYYAGKHSIRMNIDENNESMGTVEDLFGQKEIKIFNITNTTKLTTVLKSIKNENHIYRL